MGPLNLGAFSRPAPRSPEPCACANPKASQRFRPRSFSREGGQISRAVFQRVLSVGPAGLRCSRCQIPTYQPGALPSLLSFRSQNRIWILPTQLGGSSSVRTTPAWPAALPARARPVVSGSPHRRITSARAGMAPNRHQARDGRRRAPRTSGDGAEVSILFGPDIRRSAPAGMALGRRIRFGAGWPMRSEVRSAPATVMPAARAIRDRDCPATRRSETSRPGVACDGDLDVPGEECSPACSRCTRGVVVRH